MPISIPEVLTSFHQPTLPTTSLGRTPKLGPQVADDFRLRSADYAELLHGAWYREADIVFDEVLELDVAGVGGHLRAMVSNHTPRDTVVLVVDDGILFPGDIAMLLPPSFATPRSSVRHWLTSLDELESMRPRVIVPSHDPLGGAELIDAYRRYLRDVRRLTQVARQAGRSPEQAIAQIVSQLINAHSDAGRIAGAVRVAYRAEAPGTKGRYRRYPGAITSCRRMQARR